MANTVIDYSQKILNAKSDNERSNIIINMRLKASRAKRITFLRNDNVDVKRLSSVKNGMFHLAKTLGIFKEYSNNDVDFNFVFSKNNLDESVEKTHNRNNNEALYKELLTCFEEVAKNARLIEVHSDIYKGTIREDKDLENVYVFLGAFVYTDKVFPIEMAIKKFKTKENHLYMEVILSEIKKVDINPPARCFFHVGTSTTLMLIDLIRLVNDGDFLKYVPNELLTSKQIYLKNTAIQKEKDKINKIQKK